MSKSYWIITLFTDKNTIYYTFLILVRSPLKQGSLTPFCTQMMNRVSYDCKVCLECTSEYAVMILTSAKGAMSSSSTRRFVATFSDFRCHKWTGESSF